MIHILDSDSDFPAHEEWCVKANKIYVTSVFFIILEIMFLLDIVKLELYS